MGVLLALALIAPAELSAQVIAGTIQDARAAGPVVGALVVASDSVGTVVTKSLSNGEGRFRLELSAGGHLRLRVSRIGYEDLVESVGIGSDETRILRLAVRSRPISIEGLTATSDNLCGAELRGNETVHRVWQEARKALEISETTRRYAIAAYEIERFRRRRDPKTRAMLGGQTRRRTVTSEHPFRSVGASELHRRGYVQSQGDSIAYYAPDAEALLSPLFVADHCFRASREGSEGVILEFWPNLKRKVSDIRGQFLLDARSKMLRELRFSYVNAPDLLPVPEDAGGRVAFTRSLAGTVVVSEWVIRMPVVSRRLGNWPGGTAASNVVDEVWEEGGTLLRIDLGGISVRLTEQAGLTGVVVDGDTGKPVAGAAVTVVGSGRQLETDSAGRFAMTDLPSGEFPIRVWHELIDSLLFFAPEPVTVSLLGGESVHVRLRTPGRAEIRASACPEIESSLPISLDGGAAVFGLATGPGGEPLTDVTVRLTFSEWSARSAAGRPGLGGAWEQVAASYRPVAQAMRRALGRQVVVRGDARLFTTRTDDRGRYIICGIPPGHTLEISVLDDDDRVYAKKQVRLDAQVQRIDLGSPEGEP